MAMLSEIISLWWLLIASRFPLDCIVQYNDSKKRKRTMKLEQLKILVPQYKM